MNVRMKGCINDKHKLTDIYLPRKCDFTDRIITAKDRSSIQINVCDVNPDGTINKEKSEIISLCGFIRSRGHSDIALEKVMREKKII